MLQQLPESSRMPRRLGRVFAALALVVAFAATGRATTVDLSCPAMPPGQQFTTELLINVGTTPLGAYSVTLGYVPTIVTIASVTGGTTTECSSAPEDATRPCRSSSPAAASSTSASRSTSPSSPHRTS